MSAIYFLIVLILILSFVPFPVSAEIIFDAKKLRGGVRVKLFGSLTVFRATAVLEDKALKIHTKKGRYLFIGLVETAVNFFSNTTSDGVPEKQQKTVNPIKYLSLRPFKFEAVDVIVEQGGFEDIQVAALSGGIFNILGGALYAVLKTVSPETMVNMNFSYTQKNGLRLYGKSIIYLKIADIIADIVKNFTRKKILKRI